VGLANSGSESETCVGSRVHLVGVYVSFEKNFYRLPFTPPSLVRRIGPSLTCRTTLTICELQHRSSSDQGSGKNPPKSSGCHSSRCPPTTCGEKVRGEEARFTLKRTSPLISLTRLQTREETMIASTLSNTKTPIYKWLPGDTKTSQPAANYYTPLS
jgi:hypothetical protein